MYISALCSGKHDPIWLHAFSHYLNSVGFPQKLVLFDYVIVNKNIIFMFTVVIKHEEIENMFTRVKGIFMCVNLKI